MEKEEIWFGIITMVLSAILSGIVSLIVSKIEIGRNNKKEVFKNFYNKFQVLRDTIHQGRAYNFTDLSYEEQEKIISLLIETSCYQKKELSDLVYELKTNRLDNFDNLAKYNIERCNEVYNLISDVIDNEYFKYMCKYRKFK